MWRITLFISFICSLVLNVYLIMQLNIRSIEDKIQQETSLHNQYGIAPEASSAGTYVGIDNKNPIESAKQVVNKIKNSIKAKEYFNASFLISALANDHEAELPDVKLFWLGVSKVLIQQKLFTDAEDSIDAYLAFNSDDADFLYQQVDLYWQQSLLLLAIKHAYEIQYHVFSDVEKREAINFTRTLVQQQIDMLINNNSWLELREWVEDVLLFDHQNLNLQWIFAHAQYELGEFEYALNAIEPLLNEPNYKIKAEVLLAEIKLALRKPQSVQLSRQGEHFIVPALMNDSFNVSLMIDTGASISLLSESTFEALNRNSDVVYIKDLILNTAGGQVTSSIYQIEEFSIQGFVVKDFIFAVSSFASKDNDGLLGMNFLKFFDFHIDQNNNLLMLKNK